MNSKFIKTINKILTDHKTILISSLPLHTGGKFITTLLDGHPQLMVMPYEVHGYANLKTLPKSDWISAIKYAKRDVEFNKIFNIIGIKQFNDYYFFLAKHLRFSPRNFLISVTYIIYHQLGYKFKKNTSLVFFTHDFQRTVKCLNWFKNPKIIFVSRHPYNMYAGYIKKLRRSAFTNPKYDNLIRPYRYVDVLYDVHSITLDLDLNVGAIILEQLHQQPEKSMRQLSNYINMNFHKSLLKSTEFGRKWVYEGISGKVSGFGEQHKNLNLKFLGVHCLNGFNHNIKNHLNFFSYNTPCNTSFSKIKCIFDKSFFFYYIDFFLSLFLFWKRNFSFSYKIITTTKHIVRNLFFYPLIKFFDVCFHLRKIKARDKQSKYSNVKIINPLEKDSMNLNFYDDKIT